MRMSTALEGFVETLAKEVHPDWNIKVSIISVHSEHRRLTCSLNKITAVEPGAFSTELGAKRETAPRHPAYTDPTMMTSLVRGAFEQSASEAATFPYSDTAKGVEKLYELSLLDSPPLRLPLGPDGVQWVREHIASLSTDVDKYASWSDGLTSDV